MKIFEVKIEIAWLLTNFLKDVYSIYFDFQLKNLTYELEFFNLRW